MPRTSRILFPDAFYHVMNRGAARRAIYHDDNQRQLFLDLLSESTTKYEIQLHAYCLMDNHFHLLVRTPQANLSDAIRWITNQYARRVNKAQKMDGPVFRGRFKAIIVAADDYLVQVSRYVHLNPVKAKICKNPIEFPWSSYAGYLDVRKRPQWLHTEEVLRRVGTSDQAQHYARLVENPALPALDNFFRPGRSSAILGSKEFRKYLLGTIALSHLNSIDEISVEESFGRFQRIVDVISAHSSMPQVEILTGSQGKKHWVRSAAMHLSKKHCRVSHAEIATWFQVSPSAVSVGIKRFLERCTKEPKLLSNVEIIDARLGTYFE